jgi:hypothetical protein
MSMESKHRRAYNERRDTLQFPLWVPKRSINDPNLTAALED